MAQLILRTDEGKDVPIKEVQSIDSEDKTIVLFLDGYMRPCDIQIIADRMTELFERKVIVLDKQFRDKILSV